jgi:hypothetical protein
MNLTIAIFLAFASLSVGLGIGMKVENLRIADIHSSVGLCLDDTHVWAAREDKHCYDQDK